MMEALWRYMGENDLPGFPDYNPMATDSELLAKTLGTVLDKAQNLSLQRDARGKVIEDVIERYAEYLMSMPAKINRPVIQKTKVTTHEKEEEHGVQDTVEQDDGVQDTVEQDDGVEDTIEQDHGVQDTILKCKQQIIASIETNKNLVRASRLPAHHSSQFDNKDTSENSPCNPAIYAA